MQQDAEMARISKEVAAKEATEKKLRLALKHAKEAAAKERTEVAAQLQVAQQAASDAQAEARSLAEQLSQLQVWCFKLRNEARAGVSGSDII